MGFFFPIFPNSNERFLSPFSFTWTTSNYLFTFSVYTKREREREREKKGVTHFTQKTKFAEKQVRSPFSPGKNVCVQYTCSQHTARKILLAGEDLGLKFNNA